MGRKKPPGRVADFGFAFVAPALLPVILTLNFGALGSKWTAAALGCVLPIFVWIHFRNLPVWTAAEKTKANCQLLSAKCLLLVAPALLPVICTMVCFG